MRLLLDTHFLIWLALKPNEITARERALIDENALIVSAASIWELRLKWQKFDRHGRRKGILDPETALRHAADNAIEVAALSGEDCATPLDRPLPHDDPFDEMLMIYAQCLGARLLTRDQNLIGHPLAIGA